MQNKQDFMEDKTGFSTFIVHGGADGAVHADSVALQHCRQYLWPGWERRRLLRSLVYPLQNIVLSLSVGVGVGINSVIARRLVNRKRRKPTRPPRLVWD